MQSFKKPNGGRQHPAASGRTEPPPSASARASRICGGLGEGSSTQTAITNFHAGGAPAEKNHSGRGGKSPRAVTKWKGSLRTRKRKCGNCGSGNRGKREKSKTRNGRMVKEGTLQLWNRHETRSRFLPSADYRNRSNCTGIGKRSKRGLEKQGSVGSGSGG